MSTKRVLLRATFEAEWVVDPASLDAPLDEVLNAALDDPEDWATTTVVEDGVLVNFEIEVVGEAGMDS